MQHELGLGLLDAEADFTVTIDVDDRVLNRAESAERKLEMMVSMRVGSTHVTGVPSPMPRAWKPAATCSTSVTNSATVSDRPASSMSNG